METNEFIVELEDVVDGDEIIDISLLQVEIPTLHPLEVLVKKIATELSEFYNANLFFGNSQNTFCVSRYIGKKLFSRQEIYEQILEIEETFENSTKGIIIARLYDDNIEPVIRGHRRKYLRENLDVAYFRIINNNQRKFILPRRVGFS